MVKLPRAFVEASATVSEKKARIAASLQPSVPPDLGSKAKTEARIDMSAEVAGAGLCPECREPMVKSTANGIPVLICETHHIAIPVKDIE